MNMETFVTETEKRLSVHEAVCAERYKSILDSFAKSSKRMERIEYLMYGLIASVFFGREFIIDAVKKAFL